MKKGIDYFIASGRYRSGKIGLVTNHTGRTESGELTVDALIACGYRLGALFSPEHGIFGVEQDGVKTSDMKYGDIPAYSLYGKNRRPSADQLKDLDLIVFDMQEVGSRFYTYLYTLAYVMEAAADAGIPVIVTDRPAPLGRKVEGNPIDPAFDSFVGAYGLPCRTGMTIGEFARYVKANYVPDCELEVIETDRESAVGWKDPRWINPSPNMPSLSTAAVYGGTCLVEGTFLSEGRGTTRPFEQIGAPWIDGTKLAIEMRKLGLSGVDFTSTRFKPAFGKHTGEVCEGVMIHPTQMESFESLKTGVALLSSIASLYPEEAIVKGPMEGQKLSFMDKLSGSTDFGQKLEERADWRTLYSLIAGREEEFEVKRESAILYRG